MSELLIGAFIAWLLGLLAALARLKALARILLGLGAAAGIAAAVTLLPNGNAPRILPLEFAGTPVRLAYTPEALWLFGFGLAPALLAVALSTPVRSRSAGWLAGAALSLLGALAVFGVQDGYAFLIAWEVMSFGGAVMVLSEQLSRESGEATLFMLALLEVGAIALVLAVLLLARGAHGSMDFADFPASAQAMSPALRAFVGILLLVGFGAKLGLLPYYEWFPRAYASGSGVSGAIMSGVVLNAAFFALARGLIAWLPSNGSELFGLGVLVTAVGVLSAILAVLYAFQQDDWRRLLSFSSAENAAIAVTALGASLLFRADGAAALAGLAWIVALLHLAGHALAKGGLFLCADAIFSAGGSYRITQTGWLRPAGLAFGVGALFSAMSLAAMPPQIGFVTEWFSFQTVFQGFHLSNLGGRLTLALAGAGLALTAAIALATFVKVLGIGLLGAPTTPESKHVSAGYRVSVLLLGLAVLASAAGMPVWLRALDSAAATHFGAHSAQSMVNKWILVPLTDTFAFISPSWLIIVMPLLALLPLALLLNARRYRVRTTRVWYGGLREDPRRAATTSLAFSNAMRTFYSFIYRPTLDTAREHRAVAYFIRRLEFEHDVADVFGPRLFTPIQRLVWRLAGWLRALQSGDLNVYLAFIGVLLIVILALTLR